MRVLALAVLVAATTASAQVVPDRELETVKFIFNAGNYQLALQRARDAMGLANFSESQRVELHKYAGLSAFNLGEARAAEQHFLQLLRINPDYVLDPFAVPPPAIKLFEETKKKNADALNMIRQQIAIRDEQVRRETAESDRRRGLEDAERKRLEELSRNVQVKIVEKRSLLPNFVPFGVGQFLQGRNDWGVVFAVVEAVLGATSLIAYIAIETMFEPTKITIPNVLGVDGDYTFWVRQIPARRAGEHQVWQAVKLSSGIAFYVVAAVGIVDAIWHHKGEVVTYETQSAKDALTPSKRQGPKPSLSLFPLPGGAGIGLNLQW
jgi:tetratricopeptide (TPR) repeat protein